MKSNPQKAPSAVIGQLSQAWAGHPPLPAMLPFSALSVFFTIFTV